MTQRWRRIFPAEDWRREYEGAADVDFTAADRADLKSALISYVRENYPERFNDWIGSDELVIKIDVLSYLFENFNFRVDLGARENYLATAERRQSLLMLAENVGYKPSRLRRASGELRVQSVSTDESVLDSDGNPVRGEVFWNDPTDVDWRDRFVSVMNSALSSRCQYGRPIRRYSTTGSSVHSYRLDSLAPATGTYGFTVSAGTDGLPFEVVNHSLDPADGTYDEPAPGPGRAFHVLYRNDGQGANSIGTGFFLPTRQGTIGYQDFFLASPTPGAALQVSATNVAEDDVWVVEVDESGTTTREWEVVDNVYFSASGRYHCEVATRADDRIEVRFGDGRFGAAPSGRFRVWFRVGSPTPRIILPADIRDRAIVVPYASGGRIYNLRLSMSLLDTMTDAAAAESDDSIRERASKVYYAQDRMVTGEDYNSFPLSDSSILKIKASNRTFVGRGSPSSPDDPTGDLTKVRLVGDDGRLYRTAYVNSRSVAADGSTTAEEIVDLTISPLLTTSDKLNLFREAYPEVPFSEITRLQVDEVVDGLPLGRLVRGEENTQLGIYPINLGSDAEQTDAAWHVRDGALLRFEEYGGPTAMVDQVVGDGLLSGDLSLRQSVDDQALVWSVFPAFRTALTDAEESEVVGRLTLRKTFGIRWDLATEAWVTIAPADVDRTSDFSLTYAGDTSLAGLDASWMILVVFVPGSGGNDTWTITDRGVRTYFGSDREVDFIYSSADLPVDPRTGNWARDVVDILENAEARDSYRRLGRTSAFGNDPRIGTKVFIGDDTRTEFGIGATGTNALHVFVSVAGEAVGGEFEVRRAPGEDLIVFDTPPPAGAQVVIRTDASVKVLGFSRSTVTGTGSSSLYGLGIAEVPTENVFAFRNGLLINPSNDYTILEGSTQDKLSLPSNLTNGHKLTTVSAGGSGPAFVCRRFLGDGATTRFDVGVGSDLLWVFVAGLRQMPDTFTVDRGDASAYAVVLDSPPGSGVVVSVRAIAHPLLWSVLDVSFVAEEDQDTYTVPGLEPGDTEDALMVWVDGVEFATSPQGVSYEDGVVFFDQPMEGGENIQVTYFYRGASQQTGAQLSISGSFTPQPEYLPARQSWTVDGPLLHPDGYVDENGLSVRPPDADLDGTEDAPFLFRDLVLLGGDDKVLWRRTTKRGHEVWDPISLSTVPRGTYHGYRYSYAAGDDIEQVPVGSIHLAEDGTWIEADGDTDTWIEAEDQDAFRWEIGRAGLPFAWSHWAGGERRTDAAPTNVVDMYVLTSAYDVAYREWIAAGAGGEPPAPPTTDALKAAYSDIETRRAIGDVMLWRSATYKPLFGSGAVEQVQGRIFVVRDPSGSLPDTDLRVRVADYVADYFSVDNWDFGQTFYFTELAAFLHQQLAGEISSAVFVSSSGDSSFGRGFQVRSEPHEIFISTLEPSDVEVVATLQDSELRIGS